MGCLCLTRNLVLRIGIHLWCTAWKYHRSILNHIPKLDSWGWPRNLRSRQPNVPNLRFLRRHRILLRRVIQGRIPTLPRPVCTALRVPSWSKRFGGHVQSRIRVKGSRRICSRCEWSVRRYRWSFQPICLALTRQQPSSSGRKWNRNGSLPKCIRRVRRYPSGFPACRWPCRSTWFTT